MKYLTLILLFLSWIGTGAVEGYHWANPTRRKENWIVRGGNKDSGKGIIDYHGYRTFQVIFILFASYMFLGVCGLGISMIGMFVYERMVCKIVNDNWFKEAGWKYYFFGIAFKRYQWQDWGILTIGIILVFV